MHISLITILLLIFSLSQSVIVDRKSDRAHDGFIGPVKKVTTTWSPVSGYPHYLKISDTYNKNIQVYDNEGRLLQRSSFSGGDSLDEDKEYYKYDAEGSRIIYKREQLIGNPDSPPPPSPMPRPGDLPVKGDPKYVYHYDSKGNIVESTYVRGDGKRMSSSVKKYDDKGRLVESQRLENNGEIVSTTTYKYDDNQNAPLEWAYIQDGRYRFKVTYSDYEFNSKGDWSKRKSVYLESPTPNDPDTKPKTSIEYQNIEYF